MVDVYRLDPRENKWTSVTPMVTTRMFCGSAVLNECIYVAGRSSVGECQHFLSSVEYFGPRTEQWSDAAAMNSRRLVYVIILFFILLTLLLFSWV